MTLRTIGLIARGQGRLRLAEEPHIKIEINMEAIKMRTSGIGIVDYPIAGYETIRKQWWL